MVSKYELKYYTASEALYHKNISNYDKKKVCGSYDFDYNQESVLSFKSNAACLHP